MFGWIPIIGPIIDGFTSVFNGFINKDIAQIKTQGQVDIQTIKADAEVSKNAQEYISVRIARDLIMFPGSAWCGLYIWDKIVAHHYPALVWNVASLDGPLVYLPYVLLTFFFGISLKSLLGR